jgi:hypothetical protein
MVGGPFNTEHEKWKKPVSEGRGFLLVFGVKRLEPRTSSVLGKHPASQLHLQPMWRKLLNVILDVLHLKC